MKGFLAPVLTVVVLFLVVPWLPLPGLDLRSPTSLAGGAVIAIVVIYLFMVVPWASRRPLRNLEKRLAMENPESLVRPVLVRRGDRRWSDKAVLAADSRGISINGVDGGSRWISWDHLREVALVRGDTVAEHSVRMLVDDEALFLSPMRRGLFVQVPEGEVEQFAEDLRHARNTSPSRPV